MITKEFKKEYAKLNLEQKLAVDTIEGPVMVVAGPGTGKTQVLTLRIANILLKTDVASENILALTFTDAAAVNMRRRLFSIIGAPAYRVRIETFHSFCNNILSFYPESFPGVIGSAHITEVETAGIIEEIIKELPLSLLRPWGDPFLYVRDVVKKIEELKREGLIPEKFEEIVKRTEKYFKDRDDIYHSKGVYKGKMKGEALNEIRKIEKNLELALVYKAYQDTLLKKRFYDWSDMIMEVLKALEKGGDLKLMLQEEHQYILVDEHQDTNNAQNKIVELLCDFHQSPNIFVVGDEKQAIFRFQGASVENFLYFKKIYPRAKFIELFRNYRSTQNILDSAHSLLPSKSKLQSKEKNGNHVKVASFSNSNFENYWIAKKIEELIKKGEKPNEIAIIYRNNRDAFPIAVALERKNIPHEIKSDEDLFSDKFVKKFILLLDAIYHYGEDSFLIPVLHMEEFGIDPLAVYKMITGANKGRKSIYDLLEKEEVSKKVKNWVKASKNEEVTKLMETILRESGLFESMLKAKDASAFLGIEKIMEEAKRISTNNAGAVLADFMKYLDTLRSHKIFIKHPKIYYKKSSVLLMTAHRAKGLEFKNIFIIGATEKTFGPKSNRDKLSIIPEVYQKTGMPSIKNTGDEDERRLFYVAITRAKKEIFITYSNLDENSKEVLPSPFINELREDRKEIIDTSKFEQNIIANPHNFFVERKESGTKEIDQEFVLELWKSQSLSVTALNNYLECPWKYFYRNLLRIPSVPERYLLYGTSMHKAVDDLFKAMKNREVDGQFLLNSYKRHLGNLGLNLKEEKEYWEKGKKALVGWYKWAKPNLSNPIISEFSITVSLPKSEVVLAGKLDKVEFLSDTRVSITDFKTGKQKSRNEIEGKTQSASRQSGGNMKRQLVFYKLLLDLHENSARQGKWEMEKGIIEFLEPDEKGKYKKEEFEISSEEVEELKETIRKVADEIITLSFWNKTCNNKDCEYCGYRKLL